MITEACLENLRNHRLVANANPIEKMGAQVISMRNNGCLYFNAKDTSIPSPQLRISCRSMLCPS
jgi:hypothetical protein